MDQPKTTPKDFFLWAAAMITLYGSIISFINLLFGYINYVFPDVANAYYTNPYDSGISYWMSAFIILSVATIALLRFIHVTIHKDPTRADIWVRRWALYLTLFIAGLTILGDLITLLYTFLSGEDLTARFLLKVLIVLLVAGGAFIHFLADLRGYWAAEPKRANAIAVAVSLVGILAVVAGFMIIGTPSQARNYRLDQQKVSDLQNIQQQVVSYWQAKEKLPTSLVDLRDTLSYNNIPIDEQTGQPYEYKPTGPLSFTLCANFNAESVAMSTYGRTIAVPSPAGGYDYAADNWQHAGGTVCYSRTIDPQRYPPMNTIKK